MALLADHHALHVWQYIKGCLLRDPFSLNYRFKKLTIYTKKRRRHGYRLYSHIKLPTHSLYFATQYARHTCLFI